MIARSLWKSQRCQFLQPSLQGFLFSMGVHSTPCILNMAGHLFEQMPTRNYLSCNQLLFKYSCGGFNREALNLFLEMLRMEGPIVSSTLSCAVKVCGSLNEHVIGRQLHCCCIRWGFHVNVSVGTSLIDMYMKCGFVDDGRKIFNSMPCTNVVSWSSLLAGYVQNGVHYVVPELFVRMMIEGITPNSFTFAAVLGAAAAQGHMEQGLQVHCQIIKFGFISAIFVTNSLINMYSKCGSMKEAETVFDNMENKTVVSWNTMIAGLVQNGFYLKALELFRQMIVAGFSRSHLSFAPIIKSCAKLMELKLARELHCFILRSGFELDKNIMTALMVVYGKCCEIDASHRLFSAMVGHHNVVSWTAMISGMLQNHKIGQAIDTFRQMIKEDIQPNSYTYSTILAASPTISPFQIHAQVIKANYESSPSVGTALLVSYTTLGDVEKAFSVFKVINEKDIMAWSAMVKAYAQVGDTEGAIKLYCEMTREAMRPNEFTLSAIIDACASPAATADQGKLFHGISMKCGFEHAICVSSALVSMYVKRGSIESARATFEQQTDRDLVSWNSMIAGYAQHGHGRKALEIFEEMKVRHLQADRVTFLGVLSACTHTGLLEEGQAHFDSMVNEHNISPTMEHYACMVDLYGRAGKLAKAMELINGMPEPANATVWRTLLAACRAHKNVELGRLAAEELISIDPQDSTAYVLLSNVYAAVGKWNERANVRKMMDERKVKKEAGYSWIEVKNKVHSFLAGDRSHPSSDSIYRKLSEMMIKLKDAGYRPDTSFVLVDVDEERKEYMLAQHSERLAIAFGLISTPHGSPLQVVKNLRVCGDCHTAIKLLSNIEAREIVMRDSNRFHHFKRGCCSCGDYW